MRKLLLLSMLVFLSIGNFTMAQSNSSKDLNTTLKSLDLKIGQNQDGDIAKVLINRYRKNRSYLQRKYKISNREFDNIEMEIYTAMRGASPKKLARMNKLHFQKGDKLTKHLMSSVRKAFILDNNPNPASQYTAYDGDSSASNILDTAANGATVGAALVGGAAAIVALPSGPEGSAAVGAVGAAIGGLFGASLGLSIGVRDEIHNAIFK